MYFEKKSSRKSYDRKLNCFKSNLDLWYNLIQESCGGSTCRAVFSSIVKIALKSVIPVHMIMWRYFKLPCLLKVGYLRTCARRALKDSFSLEMLFSTTSSLTSLSLCWTCSSWVRTSSESKADSWAWRRMRAVSGEILIPCTPLCTHSTACESDFSYYLL